MDLYDLERRSLTLSQQSSFPMSVTSEENGRHFYLWMSDVLNFCLVALMNSWQVSSLNETVMNQILQLKPAELVRFNQRQLLRVYPSNYRVDSSNFNPQPYWNAGCHMGKAAVLSTFNLWLWSQLFIFVCMLTLCSSCAKLSN